MAEGFSDLTVGNLAARLQCSRRALYELAPTKDELLVKVVERNYQLRLADSKTRIYAHTKPLDRMIAFLESVQERNDQSRERFLRDVISAPNTNKVRLAHVMQMLNLMEGIIRDGIAQGVFRQQNPALITPLALGLLQTIADPQLAYRLDSDYATLFDRTIELFLNGILVH